jgi:subtilisin-like proprotein convertase family protein
MKKITTLRMRLPVPALIPALAVMLCAASSATAATFSFSGLGLIVPDGNPSGLANVQEVDSGITSIDSVTLTLTITGSFNGDLFVYLKKDTGYTVLLNRPGRDSGNPFGYNDDGLDVTFTAPGPGTSGDIHTYQTTATPAPGSPLTGTWEPDGRATDPDNVLTSDPRTALLSSFNGLPASGTWTLFVADLTSGDPHTLQSWSLTLTGIPEPATPLLLLASAALLTTTARRRGGSA